MSLDPAIYALVDPRDLAVRYVGASQNWARRVGTHNSTARAPGCQHITYPVIGWIRALQAEGMQPYAQPLERVPVDDLPAAEAVWVARGRSLGWALLNATDGGRGSVGFKHKPEDLERMRAIAAQRPPEHYNKLAAANHGAKRSDDVRARMSAAHSIALVASDGRRFKRISDVAGTLHVSNGLVYRHLRGEVADIKGITLRRAS